jgi:hypothetical protein
MNKKLAALGIAVALILAAVVTILTSSTAPRTTSPSTAAACNAGPADETIPTAPPTDLIWKNIGPVLVPTSATYGPTRYDKGLWTCYRHDPMGAVLAAYEIEAAAITSGWLQVANTQFVRNTGQQAFMTATEQQPPTPLQPDQVAQPTGFQVVSYTAQQATIETLADSGDGEYQAVQNTVAWSDGDWKMLLAPDGSNGPDPQIVNSTSGFVLWGGGNG